MIENAQIWPPWVFDEGTAGNARQYLGESRNTVAGNGAHLLWDFHLDSLMIKPTETTNAN